jgi:hypothetical protein
MFVEMYISMCKLGLLSLWHAIGFLCFYFFSRFKLTAIFLRFYVDFLGFALNFLELKFRFSHVFIS